MIEGCSMFSNASKFSWFGLFSIRLCIAIKLTPIGIDELLIVGLILEFSPGKPPHEKHPEIIFKGI